VPVLDILNFLRTEYKPAPGEFLQIDMPNLVDKMNLRERGKERGAQGIPATNSASFDEIEYEITEAIRTLALSEEKRTFDQISHYEQQLQAADPSGAAAEMRATAIQSVAQFEAEALAARSELERARLAVAECALAVQEFRARNRIERPVQPRKNHIWAFALLSVLFLIETAPNAILLGNGDDQGVLGGYAIAIIFSALNLAFGFIAGLLGWTNVLHRQIWRKIFGAVLALALLAMTLYLNVLVAHVRELVTAGQNTNEALRSAWMLPIAHLLDFHDALSVGLACLGMIFSLIALREGFAWQDPYPGYSAVAQHLAEVQETWERSVEQRLTMLDSVQKRHSDELRAARGSLRDRRAAIPELLASRGRLVRNFGLHIQHLEGVGRYTLAAYRDANRAARASDNPAPARFDEAWSLRGISLPEAPTPVEQGSDADWQAANEALESSMEKLQRAFQDAIAWIKGLALGETTAGPAKAAGA
jgi:hypothetical protein